MIFDTHAHYDDEAFDEDRERGADLLMRERGVGYSRERGGESWKYCRRSVSFERGSMRLSTVPCGVHPERSGQNFGEEDLKWLTAQLCRDRRSWRWVRSGWTTTGMRTGHDLQKKWFHATAGSWQRSCHKACDHS